VLGLTRPDAWDEAVSPAAADLGRVARKHAWRQVPGHQFLAIVLSDGFLHPSASGLDCRPSTRASAR
jgi:hypothetical protein